MNDGDVAKVLRGGHKNEEPLLKIKMNGPKMSYSHKNKKKKINIKKKQNK